MSTRAPAPPPAEIDWDAEQDVDLGRYARALLDRWWLPVLGLLVGAALGYLATVGSSQVYSAKSTVYLGQPYTASGNIQLQSAQTNPSTVRQIVTAEESILAAAKAAKLKPSALRGHVSVQPVSGNLAKLGQTPLVSIEVQGPTRRKTADATNVLAQAVIDSSAISGYPAAKIRNFRAQVTRDEQQTNVINQALRSGSVSTTDKLLLQLQLGNLKQDQIAASQLLSQALQVEQPRVVTKAAATRVTARSRRNSIVVAAVIGLLVGILAALAWAPVASRLRRSR
jgi:hypothetical protein